MDNFYIKILIRLLKENNLYNVKVSNKLFSKINLYQISPSQYFSIYVSTLHPNFPLESLMIIYCNLDDIYNSLIINQLCDDIQKLLKEEKNTVDISNDTLKKNIKQKTDRCYIQGLYIIKYSFDAAKKSIVRLYNNKLNTL